MLILDYPFVLIAHSIAGFGREEGNDNMDYFVYGSPSVTALFYILRNLDDVDTWFKSIFEFGNKSITGYWADPILRVSLKCF